MESCKITVYVSRIFFLVSYLEKLERKMCTRAATINKYNYIIVTQAKNLLKIILMDSLKISINGYKIK